MTRDDVMACLSDHLRIHQDTKHGDVLADLLALAYPDNPPAPLMGFGDPYPALRPHLDLILKAWGYVARQNGSVGNSYREMVRAVRFLMSQVEASQ